MSKKTAKKTPKLIKNIGASDDEIRRRHHLNPQVPVLKSPPPENKIRKKGFLIKVGEALGLQEWLWKSWSGRVLAIIVGVPAIFGICSFWKPVALYAYEKMPSYLQSVETPNKSTDNRYIAFLPEKQEAINSQKYPTPDLFPTGSGLFPVSGSKVA